MNNNELEALRRLQEQQHQQYQQMFQQFSQMFQQFSSVMAQQQQQFNDLLNSFKASTTAATIVEEKEYSSESAVATPAPQPIVNLEQEKKFETLIDKEKNALIKLKSLNEQYNNANPEEKKALIEEIKAAKRSYSSIKGQITRNRVMELSQKKGTIEARQRSSEMSKEILEAIKQTLKDFKNQNITTEENITHIEPPRSIQPDAREYAAIPDRTITTAQVQELADNVDNRKSLILDKQSHSYQKKEEIKQYEQQIFSKNIQNQFETNPNPKEINSLLESRDKLAKQLEQMKAMYGTANNEEYQQRISQLKELDRQIFGRKKANKIYKDITKKPAILYGGTYIELPKILLDLDLSVKKSI